jgi:pentatricopeptide repeat domain (PPR motif)
LLSAFEKDEYFKQALAAFKEMQQYGVVPDFIITAL